MGISMKRKDGRNVKQLIVMVAMVVLGIILATMVLAFEEPAKTITDGAMNSITKSIGQEVMEGD